MHDKLVNCGCCSCDVSFYWFARTKNSTPPDEFGWDSFLCLVWFVSRVIDVIVCYAHAHSMPMYTREGCSRALFDTAYSMQIPCQPFGVRCLCYENIFYFACGGARYFFVLLFCYGFELNGLHFMWFFEAFRVKAIALEIENIPHIYAILFIRSEEHFESRGWWNWQKANIHRI